MLDKTRLLKVEVILSLALALISIVLTVLAWKYPKTNPIPVSVVDSNTPIQLFIPIADSSITSAIAIKDPAHLTEQEKEAVRSKYERKVKILPNANGWTDTGIIIHRNQKLWVGSADRVFVNINDAESETDTISNDMGEMEHGKFGKGFDGGDYIDDYGNYASALTLDTNFILGPKDFDTLKLSAMYEPKTAAVDDPQDSPQDGAIIITVITDYDTYSNLIPGECSF